MEFLFSGRLWFRCMDIVVLGFIIIVLKFCFCWVNNYLLILFVVDWIVFFVVSLLMLLLIVLVVVFVSVEVWCCCWVLVYVDFVVLMVVSFICWDKKVGVLVIKCLVIYGMSFGLEI